MGYCVNCHRLGQVMAGPLPDFTDGSYAGDPGTIVTNGGGYAGDPGTIVAGNTGAANQSWLSSLIGFGSTIAADVTRRPTTTLYFPPMTPGVMSPYTPTGSIYGTSSYGGMSQSGLGLLLIGGLVLVLAMRGGNGRHH